MKRNKKPMETQAPTPDEIADAIVRKLDLSMSPYSMRRHLMHFGLPEEEAAQMAEGARRAVLELKKVDYDARLVFILSHLDRLLETHQREGNTKAALEVIREHNKLLRLSDHVLPLSQAERTTRPRTVLDKALEEMGPAGREEFRRDMNQMALERTGRLPDGSKRPVVEPSATEPEPRTDTPH